MSKKNIMHVLALLMSIYVDFQNIIKYPLILSAYPFSLEKVENIFHHQIGNVTHWLLFPVSDNGCFEYLALFLCSFRKFFALYESYLSSVR